MAAASSLAAQSLVFSTFFGGSAADEGNAIALGLDGTAYVTGSTQSPDLYTSPGAVMPDPASNPDFPLNPVDVFLAGLRSTDFSYPADPSTYVGGPRTDVGRAVAVGPDGGIHVAGTSVSAGDVFAFVAKLHPSGYFYEYFHTIFSSSREVPRAIAVDSKGNAWVTGIRLYDDSRHEHVQEAFVAKISPGGALLAFTLLDGSRHDEGTAIEVDAHGDIHVAGFTDSPDFPHAGSFQGTRGATDVFVARLDPSGQILDTALLGGSGPDEPAAIEIGSDGHVFISGSTGSPDFPVTVGALQPALSGPRDLFAVWLNPEGEIKASTYFGSAGSETSGGAALGPDDEALLGGTGNSGCAGGLVVRLDRTLSALQGSFCLPGAEIRAIASGVKGDAYVTGVTQGAGFPVVKAFQPQHGGNGDAFVARITFNGPSVYR